MQKGDLPHTGVAYKAICVASAVAELHIEGWGMHKSSAW